MFDQNEFDVRCEWGQQGVQQLAPSSEVVVIVDVLSFCTSVDIAVSCDGTVYPFRGPVETALEFATSIDAELAYGDYSPSGYNLSPQSLLNLRPGATIVLPSPNGSTLTTLTGTTPTLAGCLRNCRAVAAAARNFGHRIAVIPAGERWREDGSLRPSFEDWLGAGAILSYLPGSLSPEAQAAVSAFKSVETHLPDLLPKCGSGLELIQRGRDEDVELAGAVNASQTVPFLRKGAYVQFAH